MYTVCVLVSVTVQTKYVFEYPACAATSKEPTLKPAPTPVTSELPKFVTTVEYDHERTPVVVCVTRRE
jgi:hypothetical protein